MATLYSVIESFIFTAQPYILLAIQKLHTSNSSHIMEDGEQAVGGTQLEVRVFGYISVNV